MLKLFALVKSGGLYIIEDLNWQPPEYEAKLPNVPLTSRLLEQFITTGEFADLRGLTIDRPNHVWAIDITYIPMARGFIGLVHATHPGLAAVEHDGGNVLH